jgi:hypothetical protein
MQIGLLNLPLPFANLFNPRSLRRSAGGKLDRQQTNRQMNRKNNCQVLRSDSNVI